ncbi:MAG: MmgE/PrpD family protein [Dehalococcoidia bacterium]
MPFSGSIRDQLAAFAAGLQFDQLPPLVVDKAKAVLLHGLAVGLASLDDPDVALARRLALEDRRSAGPARLLGFGDAVGRLDAAFFNSVLLHARGQDDSYRMLTHPGTAILAVLLAEADGCRISGSALLTAIAAAYELQCRIARDVIPATQNHGFRSSALFAIFGATAASAKVRRLEAAQSAEALALAVSAAGGVLEAGRAGTREQVFQEPILCQAAMRAVRLAERGVTGAPLTFEGPAGLYYSFTGSAEGALSGSFDGETDWPVERVVERLGERWEILHVTMKIYSSAGFNQPVIEAAGAMAREYDLHPDDVESLRIEMNRWETVHPSPRFPRVTWQSGGPGSTAYFAAAAIAARGYPPVGPRIAYGLTSATPVEPSLAALAERVTVEASGRRQYAPRLTIRTRDGRMLLREMTGDEFKWDFATERERCRTLLSALPLRAEHPDALVTLIENLERLTDVGSLIEETIARREIVAEATASFDH